MKKIGLIVIALLALISLTVAVTHRPAIAPSSEPGTEKPSLSVHEKAEKPDIIVVDGPRIGDTVTSPLTITGRARGSWFFEASFPIRMVDSGGNIIGQGHAEAQGEWMTSDFVSFIAQLTFTTPATQTGTLVLENDNSSGNPDLSQELDIPVRFK